MSNRAVLWLKVLVHVLCLLPVIWLLEQYRSGALAMQADPVNYITHFTGDWALWLLLVDLAITPLRRMHTKLGFLVRFRRLVGLYVFFYATLHLLTYVLLFSGYDMSAAIAGVRGGHPMEIWTQLKLIWPAMLDDVEKRRFIQVGLAAYVILLMLTITSPKRVMRAMGGKNWQRLHRLIYVAGAAACIHYWWLVKTGVRTPWKVTAVLALLLLLRLGYTLRKRLAKSRKRPEVRQFQAG